MDRTLFSPRVTYDFHQRVSEIDHTTRVFLFLFFVDIFVFSIVTFRFTSSTRMIGGFSLSVLSGQAVATGVIPSTSPSPPRSVPSIPVKVLVYGAERHIKAVACK